MVAAAYGTADFLGGFASKRTTAAAVVVFSQAVGLAIMVAIVALDSQSEPTPRAFLFGAMAGTVGSVGILLLYSGLAMGRMSVVAPATAVGAALVPVAWGLTEGERPSLFALVGAALAIVAIVLISRAAHDDTSDAGVGGLDRGIGAGLAFGIVFVALSETPRGSGMWPLVAGRATSVVLVTLAALVVGWRLRPEPGDRKAILAAGVFDTTANALYLLAVRRGLLSLVAVLSSLYPAATVVLARAVLHERISRPQLAGLVLAATGVALIAKG